MSVGAKPFNLIRRRHHCRACGKIVCDACSKHRQSVSGSEHAKRVCNDCQEAPVLADLAIADLIKLQAKLAQVRLEEEDKEVKGCGTVLEGVKQWLAKRHGNFGSSDKRVTDPALRKVHHTPESQPEHQWAASATA